MSRRRFLKLLGIAGTTLVLPWSETFGEEYKHLSEEEIKKLFEEAEQHPFVQDPQKWWEKHSNRIQPILEQKETGKLGCIDEGARVDISEAGSGILYRRDKYRNLNDRRKAYADNLRERKVNVKEVTSHAYCGAATACAKEMGYKGESDKLGQEFSQGLAEELGVPYSFIDAKSMKRPGAIHNAPGIFYSPGSVPNFDEVGLPHFMKLNRGALNNHEHAVAELGLGVEILHSPHGFGSRFTKEKPCLIIVPEIKRDEKLSEQAREEAQEVAKGKDYVKVVPLAA